MSTYVVIKEFLPSNPTELSLCIGDLVLVTQKDTGMWFGSVNGKRGSFPPECVEERNNTLAMRGTLINKGINTNNIPIPGRHSSYTPTPSRPSEPPRARSNYTPSNNEEEEQQPASPKFPIQDSHRRSSLGATPESSDRQRVSRTFSSKNTNRVTKPLVPQETSPSTTPANSAKALPKFSDICVDDEDEITAPPRSPPPAWSLSMLPALPHRPPEQNETSETQSTSAPAGKKSNEELRENCLQEVYQTEKDYIEDLENIINIFITPLRLLEVVPEPTLYNIFSNVEVIINCNKEMLKELESQMSANKSLSDVRIGSVFLKLFDYFKMYKVYSANQQNSLTTVDTLLKKNAEFKKILDTCHKDPKCRGLFLQSFLIKPIQRVCKYPLLLRELIRYTPEDHVDFNDLQEAFSKINDVVSNINEYQRQAEGLQRILDLQKLVDGIDTLVAPGRYLAKEGDLHFYKSAKSKHSEKRHVFVFSDMLMLTTKKGEKKFDHKLSLPLDTLTLTVLADSTHIKNAFELSIPSSKNTKCIVGCDTIDECTVWTREIRALKKEYQKRKLLEMKTKS